MSWDLDAEVCLFKLMRLGDGVVSFSNDNQLFPSHCM